MYNHRTIISLTDISFDFKKKYKLEDGEGGLNQVSIYSSYTC